MSLAGVERSCAATVQLCHATMSLLH